MGKHNTKSGVGSNRSRNRRQPDDILNGFTKAPRKARARLKARQKDYDDVLSKSPRAGRYTRPGSMKTRTN